MTGHTIFWIGTSAAAHFSLFVSFRRLVLVREVSSETRRKSSPPSATSFLQSSYKSQTKFNMGIKLLTLKEIGETTRNCLHVRIWPHRQLVARVLRQTHFSAPATEAVWQIQLSSLEIYWLYQLGCCNEVTVTNMSSLNGIELKGGLRKLLVTVNSLTSNETKKRPFYS